MRVLVTVLGKGLVAEGGVSRYAEVGYRFPDGSVRTGAFFGLKLAEAISPGRLVILGTPSSMWDVLVDAALAQGSAADASADDLRMELMEAVDASQVSQDLLDRAARLVAGGLGFEVVLRLVPMGVDEASQKQVLEVIAEGVRGCSSASIDVTHGYRHLGMLGFLSALALERMVEGIQVESVWYGAFDMRKDGVAPAVRLDGLLRIQQWVDALNRFDASGNYGVFAPLLKQDGVAADKADCLIDASFQELNFNLRGARNKLSTVRQALGAPLLGVSGLFQNKLLERMAWIEIEYPEDRHFWLAERAMKRDDFLRAAILAQEGFYAGLTRNQGLDPWIYSNRTEVTKAFKCAIEGDKKSKMSVLPGKEPWQVITSIRNALTHGTPPPDWQQVFVGNREIKLNKALGERDLLRPIMEQALAGLRKALDQWDQLYDILKQAMAESSKAPKQKR